MAKAILTHKKSTLAFTIKKGNVHFKQVESYVTGSEDKSTDEFFGECPMDSDNLKKWMESVAASWIAGDSIRPEATAEEKEVKEKK